MNVAGAWNAQLFSVGGEAVTVAAVVLAVLLLGLGYSVSRVISRLLARVLAARVSLEPGAAIATETLTFYALFIACGLISLNLVNFPLTVFAIAGSAVAIGVGFGSQNVMNNFISGLILLFERPIRARDLVSVEGTHGIVEHIGARSTRIRGPDNTHMIVPNSHLVENSLINFTLSDDLLRTMVSVGVAYGSPVRDVERLLMQAIADQPGILADPPPRVLFADFGDNSLVFQSLFWLRARSILDRRQVESDLRYRIDELFKGAGIVIAFPQRDVHLDTLNPLEIRVVDRGPQALAP
ncbi:MAG TPA: mechanosensitive ion channel domain-containing protein [Phycisphaerae bacterium]|nr:mechanosensitive ion channel domain-containing protein [Phycisphaerae bacterium]